MSLSAKLRELRSDKKVSLQVVADAIEVSKPHVWELEKGRTKNPSLDLLKKLAIYYGVTLDFLAGLAETNSESKPAYTALLRKIDPENTSDEDLKIIKRAIDFALNEIEARKQELNDKT